MDKLEGMLENPLVPRRMLSRRRLISQALLVPALLSTLFAHTGEQTPPELPTGITSFGACAADGWVYVYGGHAGTAHEYSIDTTLFDFQRCRADGTGGWERLPGPVRVQGTSLTAHGGRIYMVGGLSARNVQPGKDEHLVSLDHAGVFNPVTQTWTALPPLPEPRSSHDGVVWDNKLYVLGGWVLTGPRLGHWPEHGYVLDLNNPSKGWDRVAQPFQRRAVAVAAVDGKIHVLGGMGPDSQTLSDVEVYDVATGEWASGPRLPKAPMNGFGAAATSVNGRLYVSTYAGQVLELDPVGGAWKSVGDLETRRFFHRMVPTGDNVLWLLGGASRQGGHLRSVERIILP